MPQSTRRAHHVHVNRSKCLQLSTLTWPVVYGGFLGSQAESADGHEAVQMGRGGAAAQLAVRVAACRVGTATTWRLGEGGLDMGHEALALLRCDKIVGSNGRHPNRNTQLPSLLPSCKASMQNLPPQQAQLAARVLK